MSNGTITKETINRLLKDVKQLIKSPLTDNGIHYIHDDVDILKGYAMIIGPEDTPYFGGYYFFEFFYVFFTSYSPSRVVWIIHDNHLRLGRNGLSNLFPINFIRRKIKL